MTKQPFQAALRRHLLGVVGAGIGAKVAAEHGDHERARAELDDALAAAHAADELLRPPGSGPPAGGGPVRTGATSGSLTERTI